MLCPKKVGTLPVEGSDEQKRTNEIGLAVPCLQHCVIEGNDITGDALLTQRAIANHVIEQGAHYHFTVKGNQPELERDIALLFETRGAPDFVEAASIEHGRIETRRIWCSAALNDYLDFPHKVRSFASRGNRLTRKPARPVLKPHWVSPAAHSRRLRPNAYWRSTAATGASKAFTTSSTGITMRIAAKSERDLGPKTSLASGALPLASSSPFRNPLSLSPK